MLPKIGRAHLVAFTGKRRGNLADRIKDFAVERFTGKLGFSFAQTNWSIADTADRDARTADLSTINCHQSGDGNDGKIRGPLIEFQEREAFVGRRLVDLDLCQDLSD